MHLHIIDSHLKPAYLKSYASGKIFFETGTYRGDTVKIVSDTGLFEHIYSVELNKELANAAKEMFKSNDKITIIDGDSTEILMNFLSGHYMMNGEEQTNYDPKKYAITFWLDAHASGPLPGSKRHGPCPLYDELDMIAGHGIPGKEEHTIFIDDRRLFGTSEWGYVKEQDVISKLLEINPKYNIFHLDGHIKDDVLCATLKQKI